MSGIGKIGSSNVANYPTQEVSRAFGNFKVEEKVCGSLQTEHVVSLTNTKMDDKSFSFQMSVLSPSAGKHTQINVRQSPLGDIQGMTVTAPGHVASEFYKGPAMFDELSQAAARNGGIRMVGKRPEAGEKGSVSREQKGGQLVVTFKPSEGTDARRNDLMFKMGADVVQAGTKRSCQSAYDTVAQMGFMAPPKVSSGGWLKK